MFPQNVWTDQSNQRIIEDAVKAVLLDYLPQEIPYMLNVKMEYFKQHDDGNKISKNTDVTLNVQ